MSVALRDTVLTWFLYFTATAFIGWVLESAFRSAQERKFVNSGFLSGPFIPIYGFGALAIALLARLLTGAPGPVFWIALSVSPTVVEYAASLLLEKAFGLRLWDYSGQPLNLRGRVCLVFSLIWVALTTLAVFRIEPFLIDRITAIDINDRYFLAGAMSMYFVMDTIASSRSIINFKAFVADLKELAARGGAMLPYPDLGSRKLPREIRRLLKPLKAFPRLSGELKPMMHAVPDWITARLEKIVGGRHFRK